MYKFSVTLVGSSPLLFGAPKTSEPDSNETGEDFEQRTWRERLNLNSKGEVIISGYAVKGSLLDASLYLGEKIKGRGNKTYSSKIKSAVRADASEFIVLDSDGSSIKAEQVQPLRKFVPSDGRTGGPKRVTKFFPFVDSWRLPIRLIITDEIVDEERIQRYLATAGSFQGLGMWRPSKGGDFGAFYLDENTVKITQLVL